ncbi:MAG: TIGR00730 family Rossman fold protein [Alloprevotella sp.]|nr:TIGR00730 family Rossman fold protein [Bacteroidales bacterium]MDD6075625.1 TIGR00730 family Rossman fold protein [Bacteroidales bacterium]MDD6554232.1 TIGR00730 family Rossman fold protein [Bacteroidales bacterium]MDY3803457.1 TIGR00730 family Rossman fold protein [Alloprevotella sp.]MDY4564863.1 TIGR00730 family Rossman fold protein [Alloprevotella sp.]
MYQKIGVYLSAREDLPASFTRAAREVGELIGSTGRTLVYGGARKGLMEVLAKSVKDSGGRVYGMVPDILVERDLVSDLIDVTFRCVDLGDRKTMMNRESDILVALPGGIGTLDEAFTVMANAGIGIARQPLVFYNVDGCWDGILSALDRLFELGLIVGKPADYYRVVADIDALRTILDDED